MSCMNWERLQNALILALEQKELLVQDEVPFEVSFRNTNLSTKLIKNAPVASIFEQLAFF